MVGLFFATHNNQLGIGGSGQTLKISTYSHLLCHFFFVRYIFTFTILNALFVQILFYAFSNEFIKGFEFK